jgi:hypothetical protein
MGAQNMMAMMKSFMPVGALLRMRLALPQNLSF